MYGVADISIPFCTDLTENYKKINIKSFTTECCHDPRQPEHKNVFTFMDYGQIQIFHSVLTEIKRNYNLFRLETNFKEINITKSKTS